MLSIGQQPNPRSQAMQKIETATFAVGLMLSSLLMFATVAPIA